MINKLDKHFNKTDNKVEFDGGPRGCLSSNNISDRCPPFDFLDTSSDSVSEDMILDYLARIIADSYLAEINGDQSNKESGDLLQSIDEGTSRGR